MPQVAYFDVEEGLSEGTEKTLEEGLSGVHGEGMAIWGPGRRGGAGAEQADVEVSEFGETPCGSPPPPGPCTLRLAFLTWTEVLCMHVGSTLLNWLAQGQRLGFP